MQLIVLIVLLLLAGCTGIGYIATSDPYGKLAQAQSMVQEDRLLLAEDVIGQALATFEKQGNVAGMADAYHAYGNLYKNDLYQNGRWTAYFQKHGTWDGTYMKSIDNFTKARDLFDQTGDDVGVAKSLIGIGNAYSARHESVKACAAYGEAVARYRSAEQSGKPLVTHQMLTGYPDVGALAEAFIANEPCGT